VRRVAAVRTSGLVKRFESTCAVDRVDLTVEDGEVRGLLGPNGAGKTTLLRMLFGLVEADEGSIELLGRPFRFSTMAVPDGIGGFVEDPRFYPYLSGRANLELLAELDGGLPRARIDEVLEQVQLTNRAGDRVGGYSTGMRQRLGIAAALLRGPRLLLLDEPTSGLDPAGNRDMQLLMRALAAEGVSVLLSSHLISEIEPACDSFTMLRMGEVVWNGTAAELRAQAPDPSYLLETSDDARTVELASERSGTSAVPLPDGGLSLTIAAGMLDQFVLALGREDVAVRRLEPHGSPLELMFFELTGGESEDRMSIASEQTQGATAGK
jgi:ABC-2 type transport system ATP-binding protein